MLTNTDLSNAAAVPPGASLVDSTDGSIWFTRSDLSLQHISPHLDNDAGY